MFEGGTLHDLSFSPKLSTRSRTFSTRGELFAPAGLQLAAAQAVAGKAVAAKAAIAKAVMA